MSRKREYNRAKEDLKRAESEIDGLLDTIQFQREKYAEHAQDSNNSHLSMPTASDNTIRLEPIHDVVTRVYDAIERISVPAHVGIDKKTEFYERIQHLKQKRYDIDNRQNIDGKENLVLDVQQLVQDVREWVNEMEEEYSF